MAAISLALIGENKEPIYIREFGDDSLSNNVYSEEALFGLEPKYENGSEYRGLHCSIRNQFILHSSLDRFDQLKGPPPGTAWRKQGATGTDGMFVGLLCPVEELRVYGYMTTTNIMIVLVVEDDAIPETQQSVDGEVKALLARIHELYIEDLLNPFKKIGSTIASKRFDEKVKKDIAAFNQSEGMI